MTYELTPLLRCYARLSISDQHPSRRRYCRVNMSYAGLYLKSAGKLLASLEEGKPHSSITDWVEVLSSDRYDELSLDGIPELVESVNIQGMSGTAVSRCTAYCGAITDGWNGVGSGSGGQEEAQVR